MVRTFIITLIFGCAIFTLYNIPRLSLAQASGVLDDLGADLMDNPQDNYPKAIFAGGCFWCLESEFRSLDGVLFTRSGYIGGTLENPTYQNITTGKTGHAEAVEVTYNPDITSYKKLTEYFLTKAHDPTQLNRQGVDVGTQYRSEIFYLDETQKDIAEEIIQDVNKTKLYSKKIVTKISPATTFWEAEGYHQQYYEKWEKTKGEVHPRVYFKKQMKKLKAKE